MCGISGILSWNHDVHSLSGEAASMAALLSHRGPDSTRIERFGTQAILSGNRLAITDPHNREACMPFYDADSQSALVFNGEIYNFKELRNRVQNYTLKTNCDSEVLFALLIECGEAALDMIRGMFSFCFVNFQDRIALLAVDISGQKPLFYNVQDGILTFSSEMLPLLSNERIEKSFDVSALTEAVCRRHIGGANTHIQQIKKVRSCHFLRFGQGELESERYYTVPFARQDLVDADLASADLYSAIEKVCDSTMHLEVKGGALLSGGIDSSTLVSEAAKRDVPLHTYSMGFEAIEGSTFQSDWPANEFPYSRVMAQAIGSHHSEIVMNVKQYFDAFDKWHALSDIPMFFHEAPCLLKLFEASSHDVKVVYSGSGVDEILDGYCGLTDLNTGREMETLVGRDVDRILSRFFAVDCRAYNCDLNLLLPEQSITDNAFSNMRYDLSPYLEQDITVSQLVLMLMFHGRMASYEFTQIDRASMHYSVEARSPFAEREFFEAATSFSPELRYRGNADKWILKKALQAKLPKEILNRNKAPFPMPTQYFFTPEFTKRGEELFTDTSYLESIGMNVDYLAKMWQSDDPLDRPMFPRIVALNRMLKRHSRFVNS